MAYNSRNFNLISSPLGGGSGRVWSYRTTDAISDVLAANYFVGAYSSGARAGDAVSVIFSDNRVADLIFSTMTTTTAVVGSRIVSTDNLVDPAAFDTAVPAGNVVVFRPEVRVSEDRSGFGSFEPAIFYNNRIGVSHAGTDAEVADVYEITIPTPSAVDATGYYARIEAVLSKLGSQGVAVIGVTLGENDPFTVTLTGNAESAHLRIDIFSDGSERQRIHYKLDQCSTDGVFTSSGGAQEIAVALPFSRMASFSVNAYTGDAVKFEACRVYSDIVVYQA